MTTRLYLPASGTPPLASLAVNSNWELTTSLVRLPCFTGKQNTALATDTRTWPATSTQQWCWWQYQSRPLAEAYDWTTADTVSMVIGKCAETSTSGDTHLAYVVRIVSGDGTVIRGVIGLYHATSTEYALMAAAATRIHSARVNGATAFSSQVGDRIIIEIGLHGVTPAAESIQMRKGDPSATVDFALTAGLTTDLDPWIELSRTVVFGFSDSVAEAATAVDTQDAAFGALSAAVVETGGAAETITNSLVTSAARLEPASAADSPSAALMALAGMVEPAAAVDTQTASFAFAASASEAGAAADMPDAFRVMIASKTEPASAVDSSVASKLATADQAEAATMQDTLEAAMVRATGVAEELYATDSLVDALFMGVSIAEQVSAVTTQDAYGEGTPIPADIIEMAEAIDVLSAEIQHVGPPQLPGRKIVGQWKQSEQFHQNEQRMIE